MLRLEIMNASCECSIQRNLDTAMMVKPAVERFLISISSPPCS